MSTDVPEGSPVDDGRSRMVGMRDLTTGSIPRHLVVFSLPMLAGSVLQVAYSLVNAFWVGKFLGTSALAAVTVSQPVIFVLIAVAAGLTLATNILIAQSVGAHRWERVKEAVQTSIILVGGISLFFLAIGMVLVKQLLSFVNTPPDIFPMASTYLRIFLWTLPFTFGIFLLGSMLRGIGDSQTPVYFQTVSVVLNAILDPLLMFGKLGLPALGLNGTAWATIISQVIAVVALVIYVARARPLVSPDWGHLRIDGATAGALLTLGLPTMVQQSVVSVSLLGITRLVSSFGTVADAAFGAAIRIDNVAFLPALTIGMAVSTIAGQNVGAGAFQRVRATFWWGLLLSGGISLVIALLAITIPDFFLRAFLSDPTVIAIGAEYLRIVGFTYLLYAVLFTSNGVINGAGHTFSTTLISVISLWGIRLPLAYLLAHELHHETGIWYAMLLSVACGMVLSLIYYFSGVWRQSFTCLTKWVRGKAC